MNEHCNIMSINDWLIIFEGESFKLRRLTRRRLTFSPAWLRNFVAACGLARSTAAYGGLRRRLWGLGRTDRYTGDMRMKWCYRNSQDRNATISMVGLLMSQLTLAFSGVGVELVITFGNLSRAIFVSGLLRCHFYWVSKLECRICVGESHRYGDGNI